METEFKRLFFGIEVAAPWPHELPVGRIIEEPHRHLTMAFLGKADYTQLKEALKTFPVPSFKVGFVGKFDQCLFLPPKHPRVVAWHMQWFEEATSIIRFYESVIHWLQKNGFAPDLRHSFSPHVTLARSPFNEKVWREKFVPLPFLLKDVHLYESLGSSKYQSLWNLTLIAPFEEIEHTADIAFKIWGDTFDHLFQHAQVALAFIFPPALPFLSQEKGFTALEDVIIALNNVVSFVDSEIGCPFKAVSFHSQLEKKDNIYCWEMIIDV